MRTRTWISRSEIAEIYEQSAKLAERNESSEPFSDNGDKIADLRSRADLMREIDGMDNKTNLRDHAVQTQLANLENDLEAEIVHRRRPKPPRQLQLVKLDESQGYL